jgi:surfeit locus 1 family protein
MLLGPRVLDGTNGFHLITPLVRANGSAVLVDRGFISEHAAAKRKYPTPDEIVEVHGMLRESQARNNFTPDNNPTKGEWYWTDVAAMADYAGGESSNVQPVLVEEIFGEYFFTQSQSNGYNYQQRVMLETPPCACPTVFQ